VDGVAVGSPVTLVGGSASLVVSTLSVSGSPHQITAYYGGDDNNNPSNSSASLLAQVVTCSQTNALLSLVDNLDGTSTLTFMGTPQAEYYLLASPDVAAPMTNWVPVAGSTNTVTNVNGLWQFTLTNTPPQQFYRSTAVVPCP
jgi:hypothetical protein